MGLADLTKTLTLYIPKLIEVIMVNKDENFVFTAFQIVVLSFKDFNDGQELLIMDFISSFCKNYLFKKKGY